MFATQGCLQKTPAAWAESQHEPPFRKRVTVEGLKAFRRNLDVWGEQPRATVITFKLCRELPYFTDGDRNFLRFHSGHGYA